MRPSTAQRHDRILSMAPKITATNDVQEIHVALSAVWEAMDGSSLKGVM
jgi:hypothetical protein